MENKLIKIYYNNIDNEPAVESIICECNEDNICELLEIPLFAYSLSLNDRILVSNDPLGKGLSFKNFYTNSGNSTIQIVQLVEGGIFKIVPLLEKILGENNIRFNSSSYIAINIPNNMDYEKIRLLLEEFFDKDIIDYKEAKLAKNHEYEDCYNYTTKE